METEIIPGQTAMASVIRNCGITNCLYDPKTGIHSNFGRGIFEFRIGDEIEVTNGGKHVITGILAFTRRGHVDYMLQTGRGRNCHIIVARPANPERMKFGFVIRTSQVLPNGTPTGSASRWVTREDAEREVQRLVSVNYPGVVQVLDSE